MPHPSDSQESTPHESNPYQSPTTQTSRTTLTDAKAAVPGRTPGAGAITLVIVVGLFAAMGAFVTTCLGTVFLVGSDYDAIGIVLGLSSVVAIVVLIGTPWIIIRWMRHR